MTETPQPLAIRLAACAKTFPEGTRALEPTDLAIGAGETLVLLGPSGCGKTTILRLIAGLSLPDAGGRVLFDEQDVTPLPIEKRNIGMVFQSYALFPNMNVAENVGYGLRIRRLPSAAIRERIAEMLAMMRIEPLADRRIDQLSGGQRQRVALARALAVRPRALLLDEPLTALDAKLRDTLRLEIDALLRSLGITTIYVTHDQAEAMALGDRIAVMDHGRLAQVGTPREIYHQPANRFVAEFIGSLNRLTGTLRNGLFTCAAGTVPWQNGAPAVQEILFRPERTRLMTPEAASLRGTVTAAFFLGDRTRLFVDVGEAQPVIVENGQRRLFTRGEVVGLQVEPQDVFAL
jgi:putative spermidine/putrescine transport system ATP-binding protein